MERSLERLLRPYGRSLSLRQGRAAIVQSRDRSVHHLKAIRRHPSGARVVAKDCSAVEMKCGIEEFRVDQCSARRSVPSKTQSSFQIKAWSYKNGSNQRSLLLNGWLMLNGHHIGEIGTYPCRPIFAPQPCGAKPPSRWSLSHLSQMGTKYGQDIDLEFMSLGALPQLRIMDQSCFWLSVCHGAQFSANQVPLDHRNKATS